MISQLRNFIALNLLNYWGWSTDKKIVVIESDDWGSIRMPSKEVYNFFLDNNIRVDRSSYNKFDSLESESDLRELFAILRKFRDSNNNYPIFTTNTVVANPDFKKIKDSNFREYHYELFTTTYKKYPGSKNCFELIRQGIDEGLIKPQFHGREHLNVIQWLNLLQNKNGKFRLAFDHNFWGLSRDVFPRMKRSIQASFDMESKNEINSLKASIEEGLNIFEKIFGYRSKSFIANNFIWDTELNQKLYEEGIEYIQGMKYQKLPIARSEAKRGMIRHYLGEKNYLGQIYLIRNCFFEPSLLSTRSLSVDKCLKSIENAFFWKKPAIITSHRLNFSGSLVQSNRKINLELLENLLNKMLNKWPELEFWSSDQLGDYIKNNQKSGYSIF